MADLLKTDLALTRRAFWEETSDRWGVDLQPERGDLALVAGRANLAQALLNRLFTRVGELSDLGHPDYGSRLYQLVGEINNARTRALAELYIRESLAYEERVKEVALITFAPPSRRADKRESLEISIVARLIDDGEPLTVSISMNL